MGKIKDADFSELPIDVKLEVVRGSVKSVSKDDEEAARIAQIVAVQMSVERSGCCNPDSWTEEYNIESDKIAHRYIEDIMTPTSSDISKRKC